MGAPPIKTPFDSLLLSIGREGVSWECTTDVLSSDF